MDIEIYSYIILPKNRAASLNNYYLLFKNEGMITRRKCGVAVKSNVYF
jgi:hypothetical protein